MGRITIRSTFAMDVETVRALARMARRLGISKSKSEALRRAIQAVAGDLPSTATKAVKALDELQHSLGLTQSKADAWAQRVRAERRSAAARHEGRSR